MRIYSETVYGNERADLVGLGYIVTAIERVENAMQWLTTTDEICQHALAEIDMLILLGEKFPHDINIKLKKSKIKEWHDIFYAWLERKEAKIPKKYRSVIRNQAEELFAKLSTFGHSLEWL